MCLSSAVVAGILCFKHASCLLVVAEIFVQAFLSSVIAVILCSNMSVSCLLQKFSGWDGIATTRDCEDFVRGFAD
jgi:hypothetical protein